MKIDNVEEEVQEGAEDNKKHRALCGELAKELVNIQLYPSDIAKIIRIGTMFPPEFKEALVGVSQREFKCAHLVSLGHV